MIMPWDIGEHLRLWVIEMLLDFSGWLFNGYFYLIGYATDSSYLTGSLDRLFGTTLVWDAVVSAHSSVVVPLAESILALFMLVQLIKISQRIDATATLPAVKDIVFLAVAYVCFHWLIINSLDIMRELFAVFNHLSTGFSSANPTGAAWESAIEFSEEEIENASLGGALTLVLAAVISLLIGVIAYIVTIVISFARAIQLYVMACFAPIPLSLLGFEETRQSGISFLKNFAAAALAGIIMIFMLISYPLILSSVVINTGTGTIGASTVTSTVLMAKFLGQGTFGAGLTALLMTLAVAIFLILGLIKSGGWAKEILGN